MVHRLLINAMDVFTWHIQTYFVYRGHVVIYGVHIVGVFVAEEAVLAIHQNMALHTGPSLRATDWNQTASLS